ncbi:uncharacterized protein [Watersipora subatra]|uniref:uncharacterized protein n=1 Tax=Watersipora subatra TaxID=2589382 RepID=UPI00355AE4C6
MADLPLLAFWGLLLIYAVSSQNSNWVEELPVCPANNPSADLKMISANHTAKQTNVMTYAKRPFSLYCCATGYAYFRWYKDGVELGSSTPHMFQYNDEETREKVFWYQLTSADCSNTSVPKYYECIFVCEAFSANSSESVSQNIPVFVYDKELAAEPGSISEFVNASAETCLYEGQTLHAFCYLWYDSNENFYEKKIKLLMENGTAVSDLIDKSVPRETRRILEDFVDPLFSKVQYIITIYNVTKEFLNQTYTCQSVTNPTVKRSFFVGICGEEPSIATEVIKESDISLKIGIPLSLLVLLVVIATILLVKFNAYANLWYKVHILRRVQQTAGGYSYDVYVIYKDISNPVVAQSIELLEHEYKLKLCIAERDFSIGAVTPQSITESLKSSKTVVAFLSNDMFEDRQSVQDWSDVSLSLSLALNKHLVLFLLEVIDQKWLKKRKDIRAALKVLKCIRCSEGFERSIRMPFMKYRRMLSLDDKPETIL